MTKIRGRLTEPWLQRQWWLLRNEFLTLRWLVVVRSESLFSTIRSRSAITDAGTAAAGSGAGGRLGSLPVLGSVIAWASSKGGTGGDPRRSPGPVMNWLRPALAVAGAVVLVVAGVFALGQIRQGIVSLSDGSTAIGPGTANPGGQGGGGPYGSGSRSSAGSRTPPNGGKAGPKPGVSHHIGVSSSPSPCTSPSSSPQSSPSPSSAPPPSSPPPSPTPSPTTSPTPTATPTPTDTTGSDGSDGPLSGFQSPAPLGGFPGNGASTTALVCVQGPGPSPTSSPA